jgi:hypothetical protein
MAPGQNRDFTAAAPWQNQQNYSPNWQQRRADRDRNRQYSAPTYYNNYDPLAAWAPQVYRSYSYNNNGYNAYPNSNYGYNGYGYAPDYNSYYTPPRESIVRTIISSFFQPDAAYYTMDTPYNGYSSYPYNNYGYAAPNYYYSNAGYMPAGYYDSGYGDPYASNYYGGGVPMFASPFSSGNSLKANLLYFGVQLLQGMLGQGYVQGSSDAQYVRAVEGPVYYDPYQAPEPAYYSPYVSSFADQRQIFEQGYQAGYEDAMRNQDPYGVYNGNGRVDVISQFLANSVLGS